MNDSLSANAAGYFIWRPAGLGPASFTSPGSNWPLASCPPNHPRCSSPFLPRATGLETAQVVDFRKHPSPVWVRDVAVGTSWRVAASRPITASNTHDRNANNLPNIKSPSCRRPSAPQDHCKPLQTLTPTIIHSVQHRTSFWQQGNRAGIQRYHGLAFPLREAHGGQPLKQRLAVGSDRPAREHQPLRLVDLSKNTPHLMAHSVGGAHDDPDSAEGARIDLAQRVGEPPWSPPSRQLLRIDPSLEHDPPRGIEHPNDFESALRQSIRSMVWHG